MLLLWRSRPIISIWSDWMSVVGIIFSVLNSSLSVSWLAWGTASPIKHLMNGRVLHEKPQAYSIWFSAIPASESATSTSYEASKSHWTSINGMLLVAKASTICDRDDIAIFTSAMGSSKHTVNECRRILVQQPNLSSRLSVAVLGLCSSVPAMVKARTMPFPRLMWSCSCLTCRRTDWES